MSRSGFFDSSNHIRSHQTSAHRVAFGHLPCYPIKGWHLLALFGKHHWDLRHFRMRMKHKLQQVMKVRDDQRPWAGLLLMDDAYWEARSETAKYHLLPPYHSLIRVTLSFSENEPSHRIYLGKHLIFGFKVHPT
jgi:hypothetical protein